MAAEVELPALRDPFSSQNVRGTADLVQGFPGVMSQRSDSLFEAAMHDNKPIVLVVEDDVVLRFSTADNLRDIGFTTVEATGSEEAVAVLMSQQIDLVFSDVNMPGNMDGIGLADWIGRHRPGLPVLLTSGSPRVAAGRAIRSGRRFISKPYALAEVEANITELLTDRPAAKTRRI